MKKIYQAPQINKLVYSGNMSLLANSPRDPFIDGVIDDGSNDGNGTEIVGGGDGNKDDTPGAKKGFWDDDYED